LSTLTSVSEFSIILKEVSSGLILYEECILHLQAILHIDRCDDYKDLVIIGEKVGKSNKREVI
jgi:hypothetical protein